jgi:DNA-binding response OmpR family regulator
LRSRPIDLVISDLCLGNLDGIELCRKIQAEFGSLPLILFSACPSSRNPERGLSNLIGCLEKPFENRELLSLVGGALNAVTENQRMRYELG